MGRPLDEDCFADGLGGSFTIREGGGMDIGLDFLGNQFANASFDSESGEWGNPQFNSNWASDVTQMMQQDFADNEQKSRNQKEKTAAALAGLSVDSSEKYRKEFDAAERRLGENFDSDKFNVEFFSSNPAVDEARKNRYLEMLRSKDPNAGSNFTSFEREYREGLSEDNTPFTWDGMISAFESHEYNQDLMKKLYGPAERNGKTETAETSILDRFSAGVAAVLSALGISTLGLGLLNRTGGAGSSAGTAGGSEPGVQSSEPARRREEGDVEGVQAKRMVHLLSRNIYSVLPG